VTQYLITEIRDSTGYVHRHISKVKDNERMTLVEAESKSEALSKHKEGYND